MSSITGGAVSIHSYERCAHEREKLRAERDELRQALKAVRPILKHGGYTTAVEWIDAALKAEKAKP